MTTLARLLAAGLLSFGLSEQRPQRPLRACWPGTASALSPFSPLQIPDLIGVLERRYLDRTGLVRHRSIGDLMRYAALNQGGDDFNDYAGFVPVKLISPGLAGPHSSDRSPAAVHLQPPG